MQNRYVNISVFNCEWRTSTSADAAVIREKVLRPETDVICLTEAYSDFFGDDGFTIECTPDYGYPIIEGRRKVMLWSRNPWTFVDNEVDQRLPSGRIVVGQTSTPIGDTTVMGVCIPWANAHVRTGRRDRNLWEDHITYLQALGDNVSGLAGNSIVLGDFNQRIPRKYQTKQAYDALEEAILSKMDLATAGQIAPIGKQSIDHVCFGRDLACEDVRGLSNLSESGRQISDHFGVKVTLRAA